MFDKGEEEGALGPRHLVIIGWRISGNVDIDILRGALDDVVARHEILRTSLERDGEGRYQRVHPPSAPEVQVIDLPRDDPRSRDVRVDEFINEIEYSTMSVTHLPHLRAVLGRLDDQDSVLVLITHHTASDGWSMQLIIRELAAFYAQRRGYGPPELPEMRQYREYAAWQQEFLAGPAAEEFREYWRDKLRGAELLAIPMDRRPSGDTTGTYAIQRFLMPRDQVAPAVQLAKALRSSPFMLLLATFSVLLSAMTGETDVTAATITSGRNELDYHDTVGPFFNLVPLRTDLAGCATLSELVARTRTTCLDAYSHELPWAHIAAAAPEVTKPYEAGDLAVWAFQLFQFPTAMDETLIGDLTISEVRRRLQSYPRTSDIPNGVLWALDLLPTGEIAGHVRFNTLEYDKRTIVEAVGRFRRTLHAVVAAPDAPLMDIVQEVRRDG